MEILSQRNYGELLDYLPRIKSSLKEWSFIDVRLTTNSDKAFAITDAAELIHSAFGDKEGKLYIGDQNEILMLVRWRANASTDEIAKKVESRLPAGSCEVKAYAATSEGLARFEMLITYAKSAAAVRQHRKEKVILVADDDMYMRMLVKEGANAGIAVQEVADGGEVLSAYKKLAPDILFLDIHLPNMDGTDILKSVLAYDPKAYIVMLSSDSSRSNVGLTMQQGAKGFMTKPFTEEKLQEYIGKCPTISLPPSGQQA